MSPVRLVGMALALAAAVTAAPAAWAGPSDAAEAAAEKAAQAAERASEAAAKAAEQSAAAADKGAEAASGGSHAEAGGTAAETSADRTVSEPSGSSGDTADRGTSGGDSGSGGTRESDSGSGSSDDKAEVASGDGKGSDDAAETSTASASDRAEARSADDKAEISGISSDRSVPAESVSAPLWKSEIARSQDPEFDRDGYPAQRGEIVALDLGQPAREALAARGFIPRDDVVLNALEARVTKLAVPAGMEAVAALELARSIDRDGTYDLGHFYGLVYATSGKREKRAKNRPAKDAAGHQPFAIGLIDTAIESRGNLASVAVESRDFAGAPGVTPADHGTAIASILAQEGARQLTVANVFHSDGRHSFTSPEAIGRALAWMVERHVPVVNISLTGPRNAILDALVQRAIARGTIIVAAAGNGGPAAPPAYPAALPNVVAVTAVDSREQVYRYANHGPYISLAALGVAVPAQLADGKVGNFTGTSFAVPHIAARLATCATTVAPSNTACVNRLERSAVDLGPPGRDDIYGYGLIR